MAKKTETPKAKPSAKHDDSASSSSSEQIGFHRGCIMTLAKERQELLRILGIVEQLIQMHGAALQELGVKPDSEVQAAVSEQPEAPKKKKPPIEDIL